MNSGDTGGILYTDWLGIRWDKVQSMLLSPMRWLVWVKCHAATDAEHRVYRPCR
jgi:hypothetical protein